MNEPHAILPATPTAPPGVTVYAVQESAVNMLPATAYGKLVVMLPSSFRTMFASQPAARRLRSIMRNMKPDDLLLPVGDPVAIALASAIMAERTGGWLNILKWDNQEKCYFPVKIDVFDRYPGTLRQSA